VRIILLLFLIIPTLAALPEAQAQKNVINLETPEGYVQANRKIHCSLEDNEPIVFTWAGSVYSRVAGERDRLLFQVEGMNIRRCVTVRDPERGVGYRMVSREIMLYKDAQNGKVLRSWENPWTGKTVEVIHVANDPVNSRRPTYGRNSDGSVPSMNLTTHGEHFFLSLEIPLFYTNPLGGGYQTYVGGTYHSAEIFNFTGRWGDLLDAKRKTAEMFVTWVRMAPWLPWMEMGARPGMMYFNAVGSKLGGWDELSETMKKEIRTSYPTYQEPPPGDDKRPNETSWTYFKKVLDARKAKKE